VLLARTPASAATRANLAVQVERSTTKLVVGGDTQELRVTVTNHGPSLASRPVLTLALPLSDRGVTVTGTNIPCTYDSPAATLTCALDPMEAGSTQPVLVTLSPPKTPDTLAVGQTVRDSGTATLTNAGPNEIDSDTSDDTDTITLDLSSPAPPSVTAVSGVVLDSESARPLVGATVLVTDSLGHGFRVVTDVNGRFILQPDPATPLAPGKLTVAADLAGYQTSRTVISATAGKAASGIQLASARIQNAEPGANPTSGVSGTPSASSSTAAGTSPNSLRPDGRDRSILIGVLVGLAVVALLAVSVGLLSLTIRRIRRQRSSPPVGQDPQGHSAEENLDSLFG
jgi:hypothetical protein